MPRKPRIQYPGAIYHFLNRGDQRDDIYYDDVDRQDFIKTLAETCQKTGFQVHAYCLMRNHFHLVAWSPEQLALRPKCAPEKLALAARLRAQTTLSVRWIALRLHLGSWKSASSRLHGWSTKPEPEQQQKLML